MSLSDPQVESSMKIVQDRTGYQSKQAISGKKPRQTQYKSTDLNEALSSYQQKNHDQIWSQLPSQFIDEHNSFTPHDSYKDHIKGFDSGNVRARDFYGMSDHREQARSQEKRQKLTHFFDNRSKYVNFPPSPDAKESKWILKWFKSLSLTERAICLTIVDKDLVQLFQTMYLTESEAGLSVGKYTTQVDEVMKHQSRYKPTQRWKVKPPFHKNLVLIDDKNQKGIIQNSEKMAVEAANKAVQSIRIISVRQENDALTIDIDWISNTEFFLKIMKLIDEDFLFREYKLTKESQVAGSLLTQEVSQKNPFYLLQDAQKEIYAFKGTDSSSQFDYSMGTQRVQLVTLAKCLLLAFEKAINVHYYMHQGKLSNQEKQHFFVKDNEITVNTFEEDLKRANWWYSLEAATRDHYLQKCKEIEKRLVLDHNKLKNVQEIQELRNQEEMSNSDDVDSYNYQKIQRSSYQQIQCEPSVGAEMYGQYGVQRRRRKDRNKESGSDRTSSSGQNPLQDYSRRQLLQGYGCQNDSDEDPDLENPASLKPLHLQQTQSQLFMGIENSSFRTRNDIVHRATSCQTEQEALVFIKYISYWRSLHNLLRAQDKDLKPHKIEDVHMIMKKEFYEYLSQAHTDQLVNDLLTEDAAGDGNQDGKKKNKNKKQKRRTKNKNKAAQESAEAQEVQKEKSPAQRSPDVQKGAAGSKTELAKQLGLSTHLSAQKSRSPSADTLPEIKVQFDRVNLTPLPAPSTQAPVNDNLSMSSQTSDSSLQMNKKMQFIAQTSIEQQKQILLLTKKVAKISKAENLLNSNERSVNEAEFNKLLGDSESQDSQDQFFEDCFQHQGEYMQRWNQMAQERGLLPGEGLSSGDLLRGAPLFEVSEGRQQSARMQKAEEERTGLISKKVHWDKYAEQDPFGTADDDLMQQNNRSQIQYLLDNDQRQPFGRQFNCSVQSRLSSDSDKDTVKNLKSMIDTLDDQDSDEKELRKMEAATNKLTQIEAQQSQQNNEEEPKKKKKKNKSRRNKRTKEAQAQVEKQPESPAAQKEASPPKPSSLSPRAAINNFFTESAPKEEPVTYLSPTKSRNSSLSDKADKLKQVATKMTQSLLRNAAIQQSLTHQVQKTSLLPQDQEDPKPQPQAATQSKKKKKRQAQLLKQQQQQQSSRLSSSSGVPSIFPLLQSPHVKNSSQSSQQQIKFDPDVKIPSRGNMSIQSAPREYTAEEEREHQQICQELDLLFSSGDSKKDSGEYAQKRSATVDIQTRASAFSCDLDELEEGCSGMSLQRKKVIEKRDKSEVPNNPESVIKSVQITEILPPKSAVAAPPQMAETVVSVKDVEEPLQPVQPRKQKKDEKGKTSAVKESATRGDTAQQKQGQEKRKDAQTKKAAPALSTPNLQQQTASVQATTPTTAVSTHGSQQAAAKTVQQFKPKPVPKPVPKQFDSYESMFQSCFQTSQEPATPSAPQQATQAPDDKNEQQKPLNFESSEDERMVASSAGTSVTESQTLRVETTHTVSIAQSEDAVMRQETVQVTKKLTKKQKRALQEQGIQVLPRQLERHEEGLQTSQVNTGSALMQQTTSQQVFFNTTSTQFDHQNRQERGVSVGFGSGQQQQQPQPMQASQQMFINQTTNQTINIYQNQFGPQPYQFNQQMQYQQQMQFQPGFCMPQQPQFYQQQMMYGNNFYNQPQQRGAYPPQMYYPMQPNFQQSSGQTYDAVPLYEQIQCDYQTIPIDTYERQWHESVGVALLAMEAKMQKHLDEAQEARDMCFELLTKVTRDTFPELNLEFDIYGSMATKLAIDTSDMDIIIYGIQPDCRSQALTQLHENLKKCKSAQQNQLILTASVPVIKLEMFFNDLGTDLKKEGPKISKIKSVKIDLIINDNQQITQSMHQTKLCADFLKKQIELHPFVKPLTICIKKYLCNKSLNSPFQGTMSSYGLVLMLLTLINDMLKQIPDLETNQQSKHQYLGRVFAQFFAVFGSPDLFNDQVMCSTKCQFEYVSQNDVIEPLKNMARPLVIMDPVDQNNNVGKQIYNFFPVVQDQFQVTFRVLLIKYRQFVDRISAHDEKIRDSDYVHKNFAKHVKQKNHEETLAQQVDSQVVELQQELAKRKGQILDRIIMVDTRTFDGIHRDETEEREKALLQNQKQMQYFLPPIDKLQRLFFHPSNLGMMEPQPVTFNQQDSDMRKQ